MLAMMSSSAVVMHALHMYTTFSPCANIHIHTDPQGVEPSLRREVVVFPIFGGQRTIIPRRWWMIKVTQVILHASISRLQGGERGE